MKNTIKLLSVVLLVTNVTQVFATDGAEPKRRTRAVFDPAAALAPAAVNLLEQQPIDHVQEVPPVPVNAGNALRRRAVFNPAAASQAAVADPYYPKPNPELLAALPEDKDAHEAYAKVIRHQHLYKEGQPQYEEWKTALDRRTKTSEHFESIIKKQRKEDSRKYFYQCVPPENKPESFRWFTQEELLNAKARGAMHIQFPEKWQ